MYNAGCGATQIRGVNQRGSVAAALRLGLSEATWHVGSAMPNRSSHSNRSSGSIVWIACSRDAGPCSRHRREQTTRQRCAHHSRDRMEWDLRAHGTRNSCEITVTPRLLAIAVTSRTSRLFPMPGWPHYADHRPAPTHRALEKDHVMVCSSSSRPTERRLRGQRPLALRRDSQASVAPAPGVCTALDPTPSQAHRESTAPCDESRCRSH